MTKIKIGVMGCADIAGRHVIPAIKHLGNEFELVAVASRTTEKGARFAEKFSCQPVSGYQGLLDSSDIDAIYMPLPTGLHEEWCLRALEAGKHLFVEKSLAMDHVSAQRIVNRARDSKLVIMENFQFTFHSQHDFVKKLVAEGEIGELRTLRASFGFPPLPGDNFRYQPEIGGGVLIDAAAYMVKVSQFILETELRVKAATLNYEDGVDIYGGAYLEGAGGEISEVAFGMDNFYQCNYELWGSKGKIIVDRAYTAPPGFKPRIILEKQDERHEVQVGADNAFQNILKEFRRCIVDRQAESKYDELLNQSRLLQELRDRALHG